MSLAKAIVVLLSLPLTSFARDVCGDRKPLVPGFSVVHGIIPSQFEIDPEGSGPRIGKGSRMIEIERLWGLGAKDIYFDSIPVGQLQAVWIDLFLKSETIRGVDFWKLQTQEGALVLENLMPNGKSEFSVDRGEVDEWRTLKFDLNQAATISKDTHLALKARTIFKKPWDPRNIAQGTRVDACIYFLLAD